MLAEQSAVSVEYRPISLRIHAMFDCILLVIGLISPWLLKYGVSSLEAKYTFAVVAVGLGLNVVTDYPVGLFRRLPFRWHRVVEFLSPPLFIVGPWVLLSDASPARLVLTGVGVGVFLNAALTRPVVMPRAGAS